MVTKMFDYNLLGVGSVIYIYLTACFALLIFNFAYMSRTSIGIRIGMHRILYWLDEILQLHCVVDAGDHIKKDRAIQKHVKKMSKQLTNVSKLVAYSQTLALIEAKYKHIDLHSYLSENYEMFQSLGLKYKRKSSIERAYYADFIRRLPPCRSECKPLFDILVSYMENSTVYCRENVLCALSSLGSVEAIENGLKLINDKKWFHHHKLISDCLAIFSGDKEKLAAVLWDKYKQWDTALMLAVVEFITTCSLDYRKIFLPILQDPGTDLEIRIAILRYYRKCIYHPAHSALLECLADDDNDNDIKMKIVAVSALMEYPSRETTDALISAVSSPVWYVRSNASSALVYMQTPESRLAGILNSEDRFAREILRYRLEYENKVS